MIDRHALLSTIAVGYTVFVGYFETTTYSVAFEQHWTRNSTIFGLQPHPQHILLSAMGARRAGALAGCIFFALLIVAWPNIRARLLLLFQISCGILAMSGVVSASSLLYRRYGHLLVASNSDGECITCTFLYVSEAILGAGVGPTCALGVSFVYGATRLSENHGNLHFRWLLTSFYVEDEAWLLALSAVAFSAILPLLFHSSMKKHGEVDSLRLLDEHQLSVRLNDSEAGRRRDIYWNPQFIVRLVITATLFSFCDLTRFAWQFTSDGIFDAIGHELAYARMYAVAADINGFVCCSISIICGGIVCCRIYIICGFRFHVCHTLPFQLRKLMLFSIVSFVCFAVVLYIDVGPQKTPHEIGIAVVIVASMGALSIETLFELLPKVFTKATFPFALLVTLASRQAWILVAKWLMPLVLKLAGSLPAYMTLLLLIQVIPVFAACCFLIEDHIARLPTQPLTRISFGMPWYANDGNNCDDEIEPASGRERPVERTPRILPMLAIRNAVRDRLQDLRDRLREHLNVSFEGYERL